MLEELLSRRSQVWTFKKDVFPDKQLIENFIKKTYELVPSKQNLMPYEVSILGPDKIDEKRELLYLSQNTQSEESTFTNTHKNFQLLAPYVLLFTQRLAFPPNLRVQKVIEVGREYPECDIEKYKRIKVVPAIEIGMFMLILSGLCLENNIDVSYTACLPSDEKRFSFVNENVYVSMSLGYKQTKEVKNDDDKPNISEVITWI